MPLSWEPSSTGTADAYFTSLKELDAWASRPVPRLEGVLPHVVRSQSTAADSARLLVCHDYKGGYAERPDSLSYTFNFWSNCDTFVYFSHHRVTVPPPGWINAAHRQGSKILGVLIFEPGSEEDCLRLLVGNLPQLLTGPAAPAHPTASLPVSPHYARLLADLAYQRGFDGYLLNFECPLQGQIEQARTLAAWVTILEAELKARVGGHAEAIWYDSVIFTGALRWQDRLNSRNLSYFLSSSGIFTNYTWPKTYPALSAQYFLSLPESLKSPSSRKKPLTLSDIYIGIDTWGRNAHGGGGFGCFRALNHIAPSSLGLSAALFGHAWTWETIQDEPGFTWDKWWSNERKLWVGPAEGSWEEVVVPPAQRRKGDSACECDQHPFRPVTSYFPTRPHPDPADLALHTTFCPGVGWGWWVNGVKVFQAKNQSQGQGGWTDVDKQTTLGNLVWPKPKVEWEDAASEAALPSVAPEIFFSDAWNGGSSLRLTINVPPNPPESPDDEDWGIFRNVWIPIQSLSALEGRRYEASLVYKVVHDSEADVEIGLSVKLPEGGDRAVEINPVSLADSDSVPGDWARLAIQFVVPPGTDEPNSGKLSTALIGITVAIVAETSPLQTLSIPVLVGQLNVFRARPAGSPEFKSQILWANFTPPLPPGSLPAGVPDSDSPESAGTITWETAASFPPLDPRAMEPIINSPEAIVSALPIYQAGWFPRFIYFNIYALAYRDQDHVGQPTEALWIGTTGFDGRRNTFRVPKNGLAVWKEAGSSDVARAFTKVRFYVQGLDELGRLIKWEECAFVDWEF